MTVADPSLEIVLLVRTPPPDAASGVEGLHAALARRLPGGWVLTVADQSGSEATWAAIGRAVAGLPATTAVRIDPDDDRAAMRRRWRASTADTVAFVELHDDRDLDAVVAPLVPRVTVEPVADRGLVTRRRALLVMAGAAGGVLLAACRAKSTTTASPAASPSSSSPPSTSTSPTTSSGSGTTTAPAATATTLQLAPEMTEGPYYLDLDLTRRDIREDRKGAPLDLTLAVVDTAGRPIGGAAVDIWHCDANGLYSGFVSASAGANGGASGSADDGTFLRGTQVSGADGRVTFTTIYPGWYRGRTVHIHVKVHVSGRTVHTGQLFFDDAFTDTVFRTTAPYSARPNRETRNTGDGIFRGGGSRSTLTVTTTGSGYAATMPTVVRTA